MILSTLDKSNINIIIKMLLLLYNQNLKYFSKKILGILNIS